jgi:uncharacterized protein (DUF2236 family)
MGTGTTIPDMPRTADSFNEKVASQRLHARESHTATPDDPEKSTSLDKAGVLDRPDPFSPNFQPKEMQKVVQEAILLSGGAVAILLQVANPGVGQGVNEHSNFAYRPADRLRTTMTYVYCMAFGTVEEKKAVIEMVHRAHAPVNGEGYNADDKDLQLWVAATLYAAGLDIYEKVFGKLDEAKADTVYQQYAVLATTLRVPPEMWPPNRKAFWEYWDSMIASFPITPHATKVASDLLYNNKAPLWIRINMPIVRLVTAQWLPPHMRYAYGLKTSKSRRAVYRILLGLTRGVYPHMPVAIRTYPMNYYLKDMRRRINDMA